MSATADLIGAPATAPYGVSKRMDRWAALAGVYKCKVWTNLPGKFKQVMRKKIALTPPVQPQMNQTQHSWVSPCFISELWTLREVEVTPNIKRDTFFLTESGHPLLSPSLCGNVITERSLFLLVRSDQIKPDEIGCPDTPDPRKQAHTSWINDSLFSLSALK